ncbi:ABC transporter permease [Muricomes intestini]|jgi:oligopeptide transport system permease protein|uniref:Oligopeptide transport system permease protein n=1 Tax=Muricomes intestini TaxID=1796634 RepID=A0A4R3KG67_9FIRM|nr:ABC transporter permease [Muricomes intestini]TCS82165.1 oligopeptide transport system permease protein [Muricomes intestini]HAX50578.1 diguanylate cyclase [Lachnospiraceae bacterium]HCR84331.1 diguanylate cyclase [Lachnospiraceae bacterium]
METISKDKFRIIGKNSERLESISRPNLSYWQDAWRRIRRNKVAFFSLALVGLYVLLAIFAPILSSHTMAAQNADAMNQFISKEYWFGTDSLGRDLWVRVWMGARVSLSIGFIATLINTVVGSLIGGIAGYYGGKVDMIIMRIVDVIYGIPSLIVTILVMVVLGPGIQSLIIAMIIVGWIGTCRVVRGEVLKQKEQDFVAAAKVLGVSNFKIIVKHILPNIMGILITNLTLAIPNAIFQEAFLSYIGLGINPPNSSWGILAKEGTKMLRVAPHELFIPAFFICTTMLALNLLGDGLRDAFDPKLRGTE